MKKYLLTGTLAIFTCCSLMGLAQDTAKPGAKPAAVEKSDKPKNRLPSNYGKLGLTDAQKEKVYGIQNSYASQLDALEAQIAALKSKRDQEVETVLTEDQRKILKNLNDAAKEAKAKKTEPTEDEKTEK